MTLEDRRKAVAAEMREAGIHTLLAFHDGAHFIEEPNVVLQLTGFKGLGPTVAVLHHDGECRLIVSPSWDADRASEHVAAVGGNDIVACVDSYLDSCGVPRSRIGVSGLHRLPGDLDRAFRSHLGESTIAADRIVERHSRGKTADEIARAEKATEIAEKGYDYMLNVARPGMREDDLATDVRTYMNALGAEDNFFMLTSGVHAEAVQVPCGRILERGDLVLGEFTPSYGGQLSQICRTFSLGPAPDVVRENYALLVESMVSGIKAARPNTRMSEVCVAMNAVMEAQDLGKYCHPPYIRRRGHGLGFGSALPGDVALDNETMLEPGMFFVIHPNQYLPGSGYMMCGEPTLIGAFEARALTRDLARLTEVPI